MPKYKVNGRTFNIPDNEVDLFEADFPEAQLHYQTNDGRKFTIYANERKDFLSDFPDATELGWGETIKEQAKQADPFQPEDNLVQPLFGSMSYQDNIGKPEDSLYYPSPLSEEGRADYEPISAEERSKQEYDMLMRQLNDFDAQNGNFMDTYEAYEKAAKHQVNEGGFALDTMEREYVNANSNDYHLRKQERDALNERIRNNSYFNKMRMEEADAANETVDAISNLMAQNEAENTELHKKMKAMNALAMNPRGSFSGFSKTKEMQDYVDERDDLLTAKRLYENTAQVYAAPINDGEDVLKKFGQGFAQRGDDLDFWTMGIVGIADDMNARAAFQKIQDKFGSVKEFANLTDAEIDALLTPSEQLLISAVMDNNAALYARKDNTAGAYEAGAGAADSLMFMAQFLLTGGIGDAATVGTAAHKRLVNWLGRKVGSMSNGLMKDVARGAVKLGVGTAESIGKALVMTPLMPHTYANIADKIMSFDDNGELMDVTDAILTGAADALIETWSESTGDFVNKILGVPGGITKGIAKKALKNVDFSDWGKVMNAPMMKILKKGGFNGFLGEMGEEFIGNAVRSISGLEPDAFKEFTKLENLLVTAGSFAPMTIFGLGTSSAQYGLAKRKLNNAQKAFESMLRDASHTEDQVKYIVDELLGSTDAHLTPERLVENFSPLLRELAFNDRYANNRTQTMQAAVDFMWQIARYRTFDGVYHRQEEQQRNDMLAEIQEGTGREFWTTRLSENAGLDGTAYENNEVRAVEFNDGRVAYVLGGDGVNNTVVYNDGQTGFLSEEQLNEDKANGSIVSDATMGLNDYLTQQVARVRMTEEEQRMFTERNSNIGQLRAQFPQDATVELGTTEAPIQGVVRQQTPDGVLVESPAGISQLTWEELGRTIGVEVNPQTDAQMEEEAINNLEIADLQRRREREQRRAQRNTAAEAALEVEQMVDDAENEGLEKPIPMKADGTVDQTAFWNESPARWAQWKTEQRQDGGAYASTYIQNAIGILEGQIAESEAAFLAESDFDAKDALEQTINQQKARLAELQDLAMQYMPSVIPAETSAEATAEQTQPGTETSQPAAVMADRQKFELDAEYQRRLSLARALAEKEMILKEYFEAISAGSMEAVVMNKQNYKQVMKEKGCSEDDILEVENTIKRAEENNESVDALHVNDQIFILADYVTSVEKGRVSYVHERQHNITKHNPSLIQRVLSLGLSREQLQKIVRTLAGTNYYDKKSDDVLADEILSSTMEIAYTFDDFSVILSKLGLPIELINLLNEINNEQRNDYTLVNARRSQNANNNAQRSSRQNDGNQGEVSGGVLGQEREGTLDNSPRGNQGAGESGESTTRGAEASEEGLQVPVAEVEEESEEESKGPDFRITGEEPEDIEDITEPDGTVRFSVRTYHDWTDNLGHHHKGTRAMVIEKMEEMKFSKRDIKKMVAKMDTAYEYMEKLRTLTDDQGRVRFEEFNEWAKATPLYKQVGRDYVKAITSLVSNGDYPINLELTTDCIKREAFTHLLNALVKRGAQLSGMGPAQIITMQKVMKQYGIEVACQLCFVEGKRLQIVNWASQIVEDWNDALEQAGVETDEYFEFGKDGDAFIPSEEWRTYEDKPKLLRALKAIDDAALLFQGIDPETFNAQRKANQEAVEQYIKEKSEAWAKKNNKPASEWKPNDVQKAEIKKLTHQGLAPSYVNENLLEYRDAFNRMRNEWLEKHPNADPLSFSPTKKQWEALDKIRNRQIDNVKAKMVRLIMEHPEMRKKMTINDLLGSKGLMEIRQQHGQPYADLYSIILQRFGTGTPKPVQDAVPYDGEVLTLTESAFKKANEIGGARLFSFSDFDITKVFDYMQMFFDLEAKRQKLQSYTKEVAAVLIFGRSNAKFNISTLANAFVPAEVQEEYKKATEKKQKELRHKWAENAGLIVDENGTITGINFSEEHSVSPEFAQSIFRDDTRNKDCGAIMVGASVNHAIYSAAVNWIRMVIPFHLSGMPLAAREKTDVLWYTDNTEYQSTRKKTKDGWSKIEASKDTFNLYEGMDQPGWDMRQRAKDYLAWCAENGYRPKFDWGINSDYYRAYCEEAGYTPNQQIIDIMDADTTDGVWNQYYKFLTDFTAYKPVFNEQGEMIDEISSPQLAVESNFDFSEMEKEVLFEGENSMLGHREENIKRTENYIEEIADRVVPFLNGEISEEEMNLRKDVHYENRADAELYLNAQKKSEGPIDLVEEAKKAQAKHDAKAKKNKKSDVSFRITPEQDKAYMDAVKAGDMETAQRMVDAAARAAGYDSPKLYHGTRNFGFTKIDTSKSDDGLSFFTTESPIIAQTYSGVKGERRINEAMGEADRKKLAEPYEEEANEYLLEHTRELAEWLNIEGRGIDIDEFATRVTDMFYDLEEWAIQEKKNSLDVLIHTIKTYDTILEEYYDKEKYASAEEQIKADDGTWDARLQVAKAIGKYVDVMNGEGSFGNYSFYANTWGMLEVECNGSNWNNIKSADLPYRGGRAWNTRGVAKYAKEEGWLGVIYKNLTDLGPRADVAEWQRNTNIYNFFRPQQQVKSADPVTYDDEGNVIPLSQRFNPENGDIRFRVRTEEEREKLFADAKEKYGVTDNFNAAGYMLPDGSLLDFSEANDGGDPNSRSLDHRDIEGIIMDNGVEYDSRWMYIADFMNEGAIRLLPESAGINMIQAPTDEQRKKIFDFIYKYNGEVILEINDERLNSIAYMEYDRRTSPSRIFRDIDGYFNDGIVPQQDVRLRMSNENQAIFVSNAAKAVEGIKQEKATPEQWLKMLEKAGGLKAGEDKWMGLSDWLKASDKKTLTKAEVLDFINENMIIINEVHYGARAEEYAAEQHALLEQRVNERYEEILNSIQDIEDYDEKRTKAFEQLKDELDEWGDYVDLDMYNVYLTFPYEDLGDYIEMADIFGVEISLGNPIYDVRLNYTTDGLNNKREIALTVPTIESWNKSDLTHFGDAGDGRAVAWIRFGETTIKNKESDEALYNQSIDELNAFWDSMREKYGNGWQEYMSEEEKLREKEIVAKYRQLRKDNYRKVLVIDEIQSKRHQEGREKGYKKNSNSPAGREIKRYFRSARDAYNAYQDQMAEKYGNDFENASSEADFREILTNEEFTNLLNLRNEWEAASLAYGPYKGGIPDAPFDKNWHELAMKRMLRYAAENGYDVIAWTKGEQQAERYGLGGKVESISSTSTTYGENPAKEIFIDFKNHAEEVTIYVDTNGNVVDHGEYEGRNLGEIVGKELAVKLLAEDTTLSGDGLRIGGEGMEGFYDKMLPAFMNKYGKKWGVKVEDIELPKLEDGLTMHSIPVTEEMKASVMEGQVMFRMRGENESARDFVQSVIDETKYAYPFVNPIRVDEVTPEVATRYGKTFERLQKTSAIFVRNNDLIVIFAHESVDDGDKVKRSIFHEATHKAIKLYELSTRVGKFFWDHSNGVEIFEDAKSHIMARYAEEKWHEEMMCTILSAAIITKTAFEIASVLPTDLRNDVELILNNIGYGRERKRSKIYWTNTATKDGRKSQSEGSVGLGAENGQRNIEKGLTAEERRIIREYFPTFGESDVRMRVNSHGKDLTEGQQEFFANSKAVDKDGNLLVLYHGTPRAGFTEFKSGFFTTSKEDAISYSGDRKGRLFDPNEKYEPETLVAGDFPLGYMIFDSEADRAAFLERFPYAEEVMSEREYEETRMGAEDEEYDALTARRKEFAEVWNAYREYERERFVDTTIGDLLANPEAYTEEDLMRAMMEYDSNASFDNLDDMSAEERKDALVSALQNANEEAEGGILDMVVPTRVPRNGEGQKHNDLGNRTYEVYANIERPYEIDANGRGSEFVSGDVYRAIEDGLASEEYDGVIVRNWRTGRHQQLGDVVIPKNGSQIKLTSNENPTESSDIQFRITESGEGDIRFSIRTKPAPKNVKKAVKLFNVDKKGNPHALFIDGSTSLDREVWLDADSPLIKDLEKLEPGYTYLVDKDGNAEQKHYKNKQKSPSKAEVEEATANGSRYILVGQYANGKKSYHNWGINGSGQVSKFAMRPGWHLTDSPSARHIGEERNPDKKEEAMYRRPNQRWFWVEYAADVDYNEEAASNPTKDIQTHIPEDGYYSFKTNTNANDVNQNWIISGSIRILDPLSREEVRRENEKNGVPDDLDYKDEVSFRVTGTPTEDVVAEGVSLSPAQLASLAGDIFAALPEESRKKITDGLNGNILGLQDAILQIPTSLATKENWNDEDRQMAEVVAEQMTKAVGIEMTRPFSASEALWTLYNAVNKSTDLVSEASRALVRRNLGFDSQTLEMEKGARDGVRFRTVGNASANASASMYNRGAANVWTRLKESFVDMNASVEKLVKAIEKRSGKVAQGFENVLMALNQQSSKGLAAMEAYEQKFLNKMFDEIRWIMDKTGFKYEDIVRYVILKHGLERNEKMAQRDAKAHYQEIYDDIIAKIKGMNPAQKRTYLTNAQLRDADAKAELARLQGVNTSALTPDQLRDHKKELAKAKKEASEAAEHLVKAQKVATLTEQDAQDELDKIFKKIEKGTDSVYKEMRKNDYSGISSMFYDTLGVDRKNYATEEEYQSALMQAKADKYDNLGDIEGAAQMEVTLFENTIQTNNLWKSINKATKETLRQQYEANMISKDQYLNLRDMFEFYVPLRGFADNTAEDMYTYYRRPNSTGYTKPILGAEGRKTEAESPFGWIAAMAGSAIASNVKNEAKLALYYFVANRPDNGIATLSRTWFVHTPGDVDANGKKIFRPAYPPFNEDLSSASAKADYEIWQANMRNLQAQGLAYEADQRLDLGNSVVNISDTNKPEHIVNVKVGGKDYTIVINGNPRAAQAINGDLNIESSAQDYSSVFGPMLRWMSSVNTSYNPEFWITNMMRDMAFTMMAVNIKEDPAYRRKFKKNYAKAFKVISMVAKNENGTLGNSYIERMYKDFVKYGGVTGYTQIKDSETWEKEIENYLTSNDPASIRNGKAMRGVKSVFHAAHRFGESLEQVSRFAAFLTAVETGKSINEAINDAKEITVNFNRKGSGKMITLEEAKYLTDKNGQPLNKLEQWAAVGLSSIAPLGRRFIMFFNAAIQGLNATYKLYAKNKTRAIGWALGYAAVGMMNAVLHAMLDDDDDYLDIPQYERRNSLMIGGNGAYFKWALPQEARAFYALGDLAVESVMGRNPHQSVIGEALKISTEILPINPSEGWKAFMPSVAIPLVELALNEDYKGAPIYNEQKWLTEEEKKRSTKWSKAYSGTGDLYIGIANVLNAVTGGDEHDAGLVNLQPEKIEHIVQSAFGGTIRTADKFISTILAWLDPEEDVTVRQFPFLNRFLTINDERYKNVHVNDVYDYYAAEAEHAISLLKQYTKNKDSKALKDLQSSDEYKWATIYSRYKKPIKKNQEAIRAADTTNERMELMKQQDELKRKMIKEISDL